MFREHHVILVPGLGDEIWPINWERFGVTTHIHRVPWKDVSEGLEPKLERLVESIDYFSKKGMVSLLGTSAGGSLVLNAYCLRRDVVDKVVIISGRMRDGGKESSLEKAAREFKAFRDSVLLADKNEKKLTEGDRKKFLTTRGLRDGIVPVSTTPLEGSINIQVPMVGHVASMVAAMTVFRKPIIEFLTR